jgi:hypothetical protein
MLRVFSHLRKSMARIRLIPFAFGIAYIIKLTLLRAIGIFF